VHIYVLGCWSRLCISFFFFATNCKCIDISFFATNCKSIYMLSSIVSSPYKVIRCDKEYGRKKFVTYSGL